MINQLPHAWIDEIMNDESLKTMVQEALTETLEELATEERKVYDEGWLEGYEAGRADEVIRAANANQN